MTSTEIARIDRAAVMPLPVVVDADVLSRSVDYAIRKGYAPAVVGKASPAYANFSGVVLFVTERVYEETLARFPEIAVARGVSVEAVERTWDSLFVGRVRVVGMDVDLVSDERVSEVARRDPDDAPTAALAVLLAPCILLTDNHSHFAAFGLAYENATTVAVDVWHLGQFMERLNIGTLPPRLAGTAVIEGGKTMVRWLGRDGTLIIVAILVGAVALYWRTDSGKRLKQAVSEGVDDFVREYGPAIQHGWEVGVAAADRLAGFAVQPGEQGALERIARHLAVYEPSMTTAEIADYLKSWGYRYVPANTHRKRVRAWLERTPCFWESERGHWIFGYHRQAIHPPMIEVVQADKAEGTLE
jgi:hypothetical protein